jgi:hypothetical protein
MLASSQLIEANAVTYSSLPNEAVPNGFDVGGVSGSGIISIETGFGLSISGSPNGFFIGDTASATFTFDAGGANSVSFTSTGAGVGSDETDDNFKVTGFGVGGTSLGTVEVSLFTTFPTYVVSSLFGNATLSAFTVSGDGPNDGGVNVASITFSPVSSSAPEPSTLLPAGLGLIALICLAVRRTQRTAHFFA